MMKSWGDDRQAPVEGEPVEGGRVGRGSMLPEGTRKEGAGSMCYRYENTE